MARTATRSATWIFLIMVSSVEAFAQGTSSPQSDRTGSQNGFSISGLGTFNSSNKVVSFEGLLARSDGQTLSIELPDQRVMRFKLDAETRYLPHDLSGRLAAFRITEVVQVKAATGDRGYFLARSVRFVRTPTSEEEAELLQSPEVNYRQAENVIDSVSIDPAQDTRKLSLVSKPGPIPTITGIAKPNSKPRGTSSVEDDLIASVRRRADEAFAGLPNFRAKLVTSMFHSNTKKVKWIPNGVIASEVAYEGDNELYSEIQLNGKRPANAPATGDSEYMRSFNNAWSSGDFETISHCVFSGLEDSDFRKASTESDAEGELAVYEFAGSRASTCVAVRSESQIAYPSYKGSLKVRPRTQDVVHVELEATDMPSGFPLDRAERSVDFGIVHIGAEEYLLPTTGFWFGCYRNSYYCFLNRIDFRDYQHFKSDSIVRFDKGN
jgi:hypothetical protein